jgi:diadenosine tetraphosphate (Ap4A) HIT family hydrolase
MNVKNKFIQKDNSRTEHQKVVMEQINEEGHCPFCRENLDKYHKKPIIALGEFWLLTDNQWPYENTKNQLLAIYKKHIEHITEMEAGAGDELIKLFSAEAKKRNIPGGALCMRFGSNPEKGNYGSTVLHLHAHLIEPDLENPSKEKVKFKIGQPKEE